MFASKTKTPQGHTEHRWQNESKALHLPQLKPLLLYHKILLAQIGGKRFAHLTVEKSTFLQPNTPQAKHLTFPD